MAKNSQEVSKPLRNLRHERFCLSYIRLDGNGTRAYMSAYPRATPESARAEAVRVLAIPSVAGRLEYLRTIEFKREWMGAEEAQALLSRNARCDIGGLVWLPGEIDAAGNAITVSRVGDRKMLHEMDPKFRQCIKAVRVKDGEWFYQLRDGDKHLTSMAQHHKIIDSDVSVSVTIGFAEKLRAATEKRLKAKK